MFFAETISADTAIGFWSIYGRWIFIAIYSIIALFLIFLLVKKKIKKSIGIIVIVCCVCLTCLMFVKVGKKTVFDPNETADFFNNLNKMLTIENISLSETTDERTVWTWSNENEQMRYIVTVRCNNDNAYNLTDEPDTDKSHISGNIDKYKYFFVPMLPQVFDEYCLLVKYFGKLYFQSDKYFVEVVYKMTGDDLIDFVSVIYPWLYTKEISLIELLEKSPDGTVFTFNPPSLL